MIKAERSIMSGSKKKNREAGFSLMEVMIALSIFSFFVTAFMAGHGANISDSSRIDEEIILSRLCEKIINITILDPPEFKESLTLTPESKNFEETEYSDYKYSIEYKRLTIPDLTKIQGKEEGEEEEDNAGGIEKMIFEELKKNVEEIIWQIQVTVTNKATGFHYILSTWLTNNEAKIKISI